MQIIEEAYPKKRFKIGKSVYKAVACFFIITIIFLGIYFRVQTKNLDKVIEINAVPPEYQTALVFGAGLKARGTPGLVLEDRIMKAIELYQRGKVLKILMSGDNRSANHNEVQAMKNLALKEGLPEEVLLLDHSGLSTYDSCFRAKNILHLDKVVLVTQKYHLKRALYVCNQLGLDAIGVNAYAHPYTYINNYRFREIPASIVDWLEVNVFQTGAEVLY